MILFPNFDEFQIYALWNIFYSQRESAFLIHFIDVCPSRFHIIFYINYYINRKPQAFTDFVSMHFEIEFLKTLFQCPFENVQYY